MKSKNRFDSSTYTYTDFANEMWGFNWRLTDTLRYHHTRCSRASGLQPLHSMFTNRKKSGVYSKFFVSFGKLRLSDQVQFIAWHGIQQRIIWISAVKVKLVDSLIWRPDSFSAEFVHGSDGKTDLTHVRVFIWTIRSLNFRTFIDALLCNNFY